MSKQNTINKSKGHFFYVQPFGFAEKKTMSDKVEIPDMIHLIPMGQWEHAAYGPILINNQDIREFMQNFNAKIRNGVYITAGHEGFEELPAQGWITDVEMRDNGLWGKVEWNELGKATLSDKQYKFISPEFYRDYEDPQTHQIYRNVLIGAALTKSPYFKELEAVVFSDKNIKKQFNDNQNNTMDLKELIAKDVTTLTDEEKVFIKEHAAELSDEEKVAFASIIEDTTADTTDTTTGETPEQKAQREADEAAAAALVDTTPEEGATGAATTTEGGEGVASTTTTETTPKVEASDKITASELQTLREKAAQGEQAFAEIKKMKLDAVVKEMVFSETNKAGKFLPMATDNLRAFMETLNDAQLAKFSEIVKQIPEAGLFNEKGTGAVTDSSAIAEVDRKVAAVRASEPKLTEGEALKRVMSENPGLQERYNAELPLAGRAL